VLFMSALTPMSPCIQQVLSSFLLPWDRPSGSLVLGHSLPRPQTYA
jgi:hypothetical protein